MPRNKFIKKTERNPVKEFYTFIFLIIFILVAFVATVRYLLDSRESIIPGSKKERNYLSFNLEMAKDDYKAGENIDINMTITNTSDKPVILKFPYSVEVDFLAYRIDNWILFKVPSLVWSYAIEKKSVKKPHTVILKPNESKVFSAKWNQKAQDGSDIKEGDYRIVSKIITDDFTISLSLARDEK